MQNKKTSKTVVLGGGTAGWLTALLVKQSQPNINITVIESEEIGILGAGEGTVPDFTAVLTYLNIGIPDVIKHCGATIKLGISFENWNGDGNSYFHEFSDSLNDDTDRWRAYYDLMSQGQSIKPLQLSYQLASQGKSSLIIDEWNQQLKTLTPFALHFNARLLAEFLRKVAESRGIQRVEGRMVSVQNDSTGDIASLTLADGSVITGDFFFDCSGFARLLIGQHYAAKWISYQDHLPMDTAMPFFLPHDNANILAQTSAIAMSSGWVWKIPVRDRYGCGYVFDSRYMDQELALKELETFFNQEIQSPRTFKFKAGCYRDCLVNNCLAVGLAQGFIEPLEATSIWVTCLTLNTFLINNMLNLRSPKSVDIFNKKTLDRNHTVVEFLYHHYLTKRNDSAFWREFREVNKPIDSAVERIQHWREQGVVPKQSLVGFPPANGHVGEMFEILSWIQVSEGLGHFDPSSLEYLRDSIPDTGQLVKTIENINRAVGSATNHSMLLNRIWNTSL